MSRSPFKHGRLVRTLAFLGTPENSREHLQARLGDAHRVAHLSALAFLVGLRAAQLDDQAVDVEGDVGEVERHQLTPPKGASKADQQ